MKIDFDSIMASGVVPRVHGNGFIQLDIGLASRLHIWGHPDLPRQKVDTSIHNHRFDFRSTCIVGRVFNIHHVVETTGAKGRTNLPTTHWAHVPEVREGEDTILVPHHEVFVSDRPKCTVVPAGMAYYAHGPDFHETTADRPSATIMEKGPNRHPEPFVLVPVGKEPDNHFNRNAFRIDNLWGIIHEVLGY